MTGICSNRADPNLRLEHAAIRGCSDERDLPQSQWGSVVARPRSDIGRVFVRHEPNLPSGGQVADIELGAFLIAAGNGPEKQELLRLIGTLV
jgi:hypothetical protein